MICAAALVGIVAACPLQPFVASETDQHAYVEFDATPYAGTHATLGNRVLAFEATYLGDNSAAVAMFDALLEEAKRSIVYDTSSKYPRQNVLGVLAEIDILLTRRNFVYPPCGLVETLTEALQPRLPVFWTLDQLVPKNRRKKYAVAESAGERFYFTDCDTTAVIYKSIGQEVGLELELIDLPSHSAIRHYMPDGTYFNWDPNDATLVSDAEYRRGLSVDAKDVISGRYLTAMTDEQIAGYFHLIRGNHFANAGKLQHAERDLVRAIQLYQHGPQARVILARMYLDNAVFGHTKKADAVKLAYEAAELDRARAEYWDLLASAYAANADFVAATAAAEKAVTFAETAAARAIYEKRRKSFTKRTMPELSRIRSEDSTPNCTW